METVNGNEVSSLFQTIMRGELSLQTADERRLELLKCFKTSLESKKISRQDVTNLFEFLKKISSEEVTNLFEFLRGTYRDEGGQEWNTLTATNEETLGDFSPTLKTTESVIGTLANLRISDEAKKDNDVEAICPLPSQGEDEVRAICEFYAKLYIYDRAAKQWKERGTGRLRLMEYGNGETLKSKVVMWREHTGTIACNFAIFPEIKIEILQNNANNLCWSCFDLTVESPEWTTFAARFTTEENANCFKSKIITAAGKLWRSMPLLLLHSPQDGSENEEEEDECFFDAESESDEVVSYCPGCIGCNSDEFQFPNYTLEMDEPLIELSLHVDACTEISPESFKWW